jgi:hypothetical protein
MAASHVCAFHAHLAVEHACLAGAATRSSRFPSAVAKFLVPRHSVHAPVVAVLSANVYVLIRACLRG